MGIIIGNTRYVVGAQRERIPAAQQPSKIQSKVQQFKQVYESTYPYASMYERQGYWNLVFSTEQGVALGDLVRSNIDDNNFVWINQVDDGSHLVVVGHGSDVDEKHVKPGESDKLFWNSIVRDLDQYKVYLYGELPEDLKGFTQFDIDERSNAIISDSPLINKLSSFTGATLMPLEEALKKHTSAGNKPVLVAGLIAIVAIGSVLFFTLGGNEKEQEVVDDFADYRQQFQTPSATAVLNDVWSITEGIQFIAGWNLRSCSLSGSHLSCEFSPTPSAYVSNLENRLTHIGRDFTVDMVKENAIANIALQLEDNSRPYLITPVSESEREVRFNLFSNKVVDSVDFDTTVPGNHWSSRHVLVKKSGAGSHTLLQLAKATRHLPVFIDSLTVDRAGVAYNIEANLKLVGAN